MIAERPAEGILRHNAHADLVGNHHHRGRAGQQTCLKRGTFRRHICLRQKNIGQPKRGAIQQDHIGWRNAGQNRRHIARRLDASPNRPPGRPDVRRSGRASRHPRLLPWRCNGVCGRYLSPAVRPASTCPSVRRQSQGSTPAKSTFHLIRSWAWCLSERKPAIKCANLRRLAWHGTGSLTRD